eukprot:COSAG03_NODE_21652_length_301_cov_1.024752_1_plen_40_part_01
MPTDALENTALWPNLRVSHPETYKVRRLAVDMSRAGASTQ